jgi:hypothetical protein
MRTSRRNNDALRRPTTPGTWWPRPKLRREMRTASDDGLVLHLTNTPPNFWKGRVDTRLALSGIVGGLIVVIGAAVREALTGGGQLFAELLIAAAIIALLFLYGYMRLWNASVFMRSGRIGVTNWLGLSRSVPVESVDHFHRTAEVWTGEQLPRGVLFIVTKDRRTSLRFGGGDRLEPGGLERIAARIGVPIEGSWTELPTWKP